MIQTLRVKPEIREITKRMRNRKNRIFATPAEATAIPLNPKIAATMATMKKTSAQFSIPELPSGRLSRA